jgi:hypothetical protein
MVLADIAKGYFRSRALAAAARLGVADALGDDEREVEQLAVACAAHRASLYRLLRALASFGVVAETRPGRFVLTPFGQPLRKDHPNSEWASVVFWGELIADNWARLTECVRTGDATRARLEGLPTLWSQTSDAQAIFHAVFGAIPKEDYSPVVGAWDFSRCRVVADLGGAGGALITAVLNAYPDVRGMLVDRQEAIDRAAAQVGRDGLAERCQLVAADLSEGVPEGADVYMMKHVLHGYDDLSAIRILHHCRFALPAGGRLLVIEFVLPDAVGEPDEQLEDQLMSDLNMLAVTGGKERSALEWTRLLNSTGFESIRVIPVAGGLSIIEAS